MKSLTINGEECFFYLEEHDDAESGALGAVLCSMVLNPDKSGDWLSFRAAYNDWDAAKAAYDALTPENAAWRIAQAKKSHVSGTLSPSE